MQKRGKLWDLAHFYNQKIIEDLRMIGEKPA